jgi:hypothetical protein
METLETEKISRDINVNDGNDVSNWSLSDFMNNLTNEEKNNILDKTDRYILYLTNDRAGPYWDSRVKWVHAMLNKQFYEPPSVTEKIICNIRGTNLRFDFIIKTNLYSFLVCDKEIKRYVKNKSKEGYNYKFLLDLVQKFVKNRPLTNNDKKIFYTTIYSGEKIGDCLNSFYRYFKKRIGGKRNYSCKIKRKCRINVKGKKSRKNKKK